MSVAKRTGSLLIAYLTNVYPAVSHTFIRREILELERRGHRVVRWSVRRSGDLVDPLDRSEAARTEVLLERGVLPLLTGMLQVALRRPLRFANAFRTAMRLSRRSDRGWIRHTAYLVEACRLLQLAREEGIGHVHVHFGTNAAAVALLSKQLGGPDYSFTIHGPDEWDAPIALSLADKVTACVAVIVISHHGAAQLRRWVDPEHWHKIQLIRCGLEDSDFAEPEPIAAESRTLLCVGRLAPQKGQAVLLDAVRRLCDARVEARIVLAGDGEMRPWLASRIAELRLDAQVTITGWLSGDAVRAHLRSCRALVLPSFAEGLPVAVMESLAAARPVITTYVGGIPELVEDGASGWLVPAGDVESLERALKEALLAPAGNLDRMGQTGRRKARSRHHLPTEVDKLEIVFRSCSASSPVGRASAASAPTDGRDGA